MNPTQFTLRICLVSVALACLPGAATGTQTELTSGESISLKGSGQLPPGTTLKAIKRKGSVVYALLGPQARRAGGFRIVATRADGSVAHNYAIPEPDLFDFDIASTGQLYVLMNAKGSPELRGYGGKGEISERVNLPQQYLKLKLTAGGIALLTGTGDVHVGRISGNRFSVVRSIPQVVPPTPGACCNLISVVRYLMDESATGELLLLDRADLLLYAVNLSSGQVRQALLQSPDTDAARANYQKIQDGFATQTPSKGKLATGMIGLAMSVDDSGAVWLVLSPVDRRKGAVLNQFDASGKYRGAFTCRLAGKDGSILDPVSLDVTSSRILLTARSGMAATYAR